MSEPGSKRSTYLKRGLGRVGLTVLCVLTGSGMLGPWADASQDDAARAEPRVGSVLEESARVTLRTARLRIDAVRGVAVADPVDCRSLGLDDLVVTLRGQRLQPDALVDLERRQVPTLHALLIDTSGSMIGKLGFVREAAASYVQHLRPGLDRALVATFDEDVSMIQVATADHDVILQGIERVRMGHATSLNDGLFAIADELISYTERPVVILLTDGYDTASLYERDDVRTLIDSRPDLLVFAVGYALPEITAGKAGVSSAKRFLQNLTTRTGGAFFDVPTASRLDRAYRRIREMLASEVVLTLNDPEPTAEPGRIKVRSKHPSCKVTVFRHDRDPATQGSDPAAQVDASTPGNGMALVPSAPLQTLYGLPGSTDIPAACRLEPEQPLPDAACSVSAQGGRVSGCALDIAQDLGMLYSTLEVSRWEINNWIDLRVRPFGFDVPPFAELPEDPVELLDSLAAQTLAVPELDDVRDPRKLPLERHARPFVTIPSLLNGRTFLDVRKGVGAALAQYPDYAAWVHDRRQERAERELEALRSRFRRIAPTLSDAKLEQFVDASADGQRIRLESATTSPRDGGRYLSAWLGDRSAYDLFRSWERDHANRLLAGEPPSTAFPEAWAALRRVFFVPSYARVLTLLHPVHDPVQNRVGFWRIVLPRVSWLLPRVQDSARHPEFGDLPLDLIPDVPFGYRLLASRPQLRVLQEQGYRVAEIQYELTGKPWKRDPPRAFREVRVAVTLRAPAGGANVRLVADARLDAAHGTLLVEHCAWQGAEVAGLGDCAPGRAPAAAAVSAPRGADSAAED